MTIHGRALFEVPEGKLEEFELAAAGLSDAAAEESGTLNYRWYSSAKPGAFVVLEQYADPASFVMHIKNQAAPMARLEKCATLVSVELYGSLGLELRTRFADHPLFSLFDDFPDATDQGSVVR